MADQAKTAMQKMTKLSAEDAQNPSEVTKSLTEITRTSMRDVLGSDLDHGSRDKNSYGILRNAAS